MSLFEIPSHFADKLTRGMWPVFEGFGNIANCMIADAEFILIDERVVNSVDCEIAQLVIVERGSSLIVPKSERLEKILIDDIRAGRYYRVAHPVFDQINNNLLESSTN